MKVLFALALLTVVCAIPRPERRSVLLSEPREVLAPPEPVLDVEEKNEHGDSAEEPAGALLSGVQNSEESDDEDDDDDKHISLDDLIKALVEIRDYIKNKIHDKLAHNEDDDDDIHVPSERVPDNEENSSEVPESAPQEEQEGSSEESSSGIPDISDEPEISTPSDLEVVTPSGSEDGSAVGLEVVTPSESEIVTPSDSETVPLSDLEIVNPSESEVASPMSEDVVRVNGIVNRRSVIDDEIVDSVSNAIPAVNDVVSEESDVNNEEDEENKPSEDSEQPSEEEVRERVSNALARLRDRLAASQPQIPSFVRPYIHRN